MDSVRFYRVGNRALTGVRGVAGIPAGRVLVPLTRPSCLGFNRTVNAGVLLWARRELRHRWGTLVPLVVLVAVAGGASVAAAAAARRTSTAFDRMLDVTHEPNLSVNGAGEKGSPISIRSCSTGSCRSTA